MADRPVPGLAEGAGVSSEALLSGVLVVEVADGVAAPFAARLLADAGARCIKVERPEGDVSRSWTVPGTDRSPAFMAFNHGKESVVADVDTPEGAELLDRLLARADVVVDDGRLDVARTRALAPGAVIVSVTPFGRSNSSEGRPATEIVAYAFAGAMSSTGLADRPPHYLGGSLVQAQAGNVAACATLAALLRAEADGEGQALDVAWVETEAGGMDRAAPYLTAYSYCGENARREVPADSGVPAGAYPCADGYVAVATYGWTIAKMLDTTGDPELDSVLRGSPGEIFRPAGRQAVERALGAWLATHTRTEITRAAQRNGWTVTPDNEMLELGTDPFLRAAGAVEEVTIEGVGPVVVPGPVFRCPGGPRRRGSWPALGQHTVQVASELGDGGRPRARRPPSPSGALPLAGVRVLDLCVVYSGPFATELLADLGAEVIKVESRQHYPDTTKGPRRYSEKAVKALNNTLRGFPDGVPGPRPWERSSRVHVVGRNKLSMTVDLERPAGREIFLDLVDRSDVVIENNSPRLLPKLGLEWEVLHARNPKLVLIRLPALGIDGDAALAGVGSNFEAMIGFASFRGYPDVDRRARQPTFRMDAATGPMGAFATMAALRRARRTGLGMEVVVSQTTNLLHHAADVLMEAQLEGRNPSPPGNRNARMVPHGCYRARGDDRWVVVACRDDEDWRRLVAAVAEPPPVPVAAGFGERRTAEEAIEGWLGGWIATRDAREVEAQLVAAGVPASMVRRESDKFEDPFYTERRWFLTLEHPEAGVRRYPGHLWKSSAGPLSSHRPAPTLGQDNDYVYRRVLGYPDSEIERLIEEGHIGTTYVFEAEGARSA